jgi:TPR repeat protein
MKSTIAASVWLAVTAALFLSQESPQNRSDQPSPAPHYLTQYDYDELTRSARRVRPEDVSGLEKRAKDGDSNSQLLVATLYRWGCGVVKRNRNAAQDWYGKAADQGSSIAENEIGNYQKGLGKNKEEALRWYRRAAEHPDSIAEHNLGRLLAETEGASKGREAAPWLRRSVEHGDDMAVEDLIKLYNDGMANPEKSLEENRREGLMLLETWAEQGRAAAQTELALSYWLEHLGLHKDFAQAFQWMSKAAEKSPEAEAFLGQFYTAGIGAEPNNEEALRWYRKSAEHGHWRGQVNLAYRYEQGRGVAKDPVQAVHWFQAAAEQKYPDAMYHLAQVYESGKGVPRDKITALMWFILAREASSMNDFPTNPQYIGSSAFRNPKKRDYQEAERRAEAWWDQHGCQ